MDTDSGTEGMEKKEGENSHPESQNQAWFRVFYYYSNIKIEKTEK